jgi:hypothetical protein
MNLKTEKAVRKLLFLVVLLDYTQGLAHARQMLYC